MMCIEVPENVERIISAINLSVASSWFFFSKSKHVYIDEIYLHIHIVFEIIIEQGSA